MKERPIIFSGPMVRAILEGRKTQTRRVVKPQPDNGLIHTGFISCSTDRKREGAASWVDCVPCVRKSLAVHCPYGQPGDRLWVRETWCPKPETSHGDCVGYRANMVYRCGKAMPEDYEMIVTRPWRPSIHMPRWASRITLEITKVRVERLQEITTDDIRAEGVDDGYTNPRMGKRHDSGMRMAWIKLWESINGAGSFESNPWVWVVEFTIVLGGAA
jgi:hypothetical protein